MLADWRYPEEEEGETEREIRSKKMSGIKNRKNLECTIDRGSPRERLGKREERERRERGEERMSDYWSQQEAVMVETVIFQ